MYSLKNIISIVLKVLVGLISFYLIYARLKNDVTPDKLQIIGNAFSSSTSYILLIVCALLIPFNWGIESHKWKIITAPVESISFYRANQSVYAGLCVGNLSPGRATEFLAKILFFQTQNRPTITLLHFANGMFQLSVTIVFGLLAVAVFYQEKISSEQSVAVWVGLFCILLLGFFTFFISKFHAIQKWAGKKFEKSFTHNALPFRFTKQLIIQLLLWSVLRYTVFIMQFILIIKIFGIETVSSKLIAGISIYFLLTTVIPMFSFIEPAIRSAIALFVFSGSGIPELALVISAILLWVLNIVFPSIAGYYFIVKEKFDFTLFKKA